MIQAAAPGKVLLTGAYAVLGGAPAVVMAVDRYARATLPSCGASGFREVDAAFGGDSPAVRADGFFEGGRKLGLGSSAAALVSALAAKATADGFDVSETSVRYTLLTAARSAHAAVQGGGSGVDVAASIFGGVSRYAVDSKGSPTVRRLAWPTPLVVQVYDSGESAQTASLLARLGTFRDADPSGCERLTRVLAIAAERAASAFEERDANRFVVEARGFASALAGLGQGASVPIFSPAFAQASRQVSGPDACFFPSGAGGGDIGIYLALAPPSPAIDATLRSFGFSPLRLKLDLRGVHTLEPSDD